MHTERLNGRSYAPIYKTPKFKSTGSGLKINVLSSMANDEVKRHMTYLKATNWRLFIMFIQQLIRSFIGHKVFLIIFNLMVHHGKIIQKWGPEYRSEIFGSFIYRRIVRIQTLHEYLNHIMKDDLQRQISPHTL
jgi:hypothetical protein